MRKYSACQRLVCLATMHTEISYRPYGHFIYLAIKARVDSTWIERIANIRISTRAIADAAGTVHVLHGLSQCVTLYKERSV